jgi:hypothetical protein
MISEKITINDMIVQRDDGIIIARTECHKCHSRVSGITTAKKTIFGYKAEFHCCRCMTKVVARVRDIWSENDICLSYDMLNYMEESAAERDVMEKEGAVS